MALEIVVFVVFAIVFLFGIYIAKDAKWLIKNREYKLAAAFVIMSAFCVIAPVYFAVKLWGPSA